MNCVECGRQMWKRAPGEWVCKGGHVTGTESLPAPEPVKARRPWPRYVRDGALAALVGDALLRLLA